MLCVTVVCGGGARPAQEELAVAAAGAAPGKQQAVRKELAPLAVTAKVTAQLLCGLRPAACGLRVGGSVPSPPGNGLLGRLALPPQREKASSFRGAE
eukprot:COSAG01_NODE_32243_length_584_cov_1.032990_1_plen_96_part_01